MILECQGGGWTRSMGWNARNPIKRIFDRLFLEFWVFAEDSTRNSLTKNQCTIYGDLLADSAKSLLHVTLSNPPYMETMWSETKSGWGGCQLTS